MGIFDININKKIKENKDILIKLKEELEANSKESILSFDLLELNNFKSKNSLLSYDLKIKTAKDSILIEGELKEVLILTILIILSILFTYGVGVIFVVLYTYYQKLSSSKYIEKVINNLS